MFLKVKITKYQTQRHQQWKRVRPIKQTTSKLLIKITLTKASNIDHVDLSLYYKYRRSRLIHVDHMDKTRWIRTADMYIWQSLSSVFWLHQMIFWTNLCEK